MCTSYGFVCCLLAAVALCLVSAVRLFLLATGYVSWVISTTNTTQSPVPRPREMLQYMPAKLSSSVYEVRKKLPGICLKPLGFITFCVWMLAVVRKHQRAKLPTLVVHVFSHTHVYDRPRAKSPARVRIFQATT